ncbi:MAG: tyrosine-type recombinase/integrase [Elainellaceae cyanobacterium]
MGAQRLTETKIRSLQPAPSRQEIPDSLLPGFYLVVQPSGKKSFAVRYRAHGKTKKLTLGPFPALSLGEAREKARKAMEEVLGGDDPALAKRRRKIAPQTVLEAVERFLEAHSAKNRTHHETARIFRKEVLPVLGHVPLEIVRKRDLIGILDPIAERAPYQANRTLAAIRKFFNWAVSKDLIEASPAAGISPPAKERSRHRLLTEEEIDALLKASDQQPVYFREWVLLLVLTGQRREQVTAMRWDEVDREARTWSMAPDRTKNEDPHTVPLSGRVIELLQGLPRLVGSPYVFPAANVSDRPMSGFSKRKKRLHSAMEEILSREVPDWRLHDIRRAFSSGMAKLGVRKEVTERLLNHRSGSFAGVAGIYDRYDYWDEAVEAMERWGESICI